ncbi:MAG: hypothetical protein ABWY55_10455 [Microbacterium sp.]
MDTVDSARGVDERTPGDDDPTEHAGDRLTGESSAGRGTRRLGRWVIAAGVGALVVAAATTAVVVAMTSASDSPPPVAQTANPSASITAEPTPSPSVTVPSEPSVASVTEGAALDAWATSGGAIADGRYLRIETRSEILQTVTPAGVTQDPFTARPDVTSAWTYFTTYVNYVPADRSGEWVQVLQPEIEIGRQFGPTAAADSQAWLNNLRREEIITRGTGGILVDEDADAYFAAMPRDPQALVDWNRARMVAGNSPGDSAVFQILSQDLSLNFAPADLRASMFRALALLPGVELASVDGSVATLAYRSPTYPLVDTISIDSITGHVVSTTVTLGSGGVVVPDSVPNGRTWTTISAVDSAP